MNPFRIVAQAQAERLRWQMAYQTVLAVRPLNLAALWEARRACERANQHACRVQNGLDTWRQLRRDSLGPCLDPVEAGQRRLSWAALKKALGDLEAQATGVDAWLLTLERVSRATRKAGDRWSFSLVAAIRQALTRPDALQDELLRLPVEQLIRLVRTLSPWATTLEQAERALACWAEERRLEREADCHLDAAA